MSEASNVDDLMEKGEAAAKTEESAAASEIASSLPSPASTATTASGLLKTHHQLDAGRLKLAIALS